MLKNIMNKDRSTKGSVKNLPKSCLFEVSWEVCNKVGGIYTVLTSKMHEVSTEFGHDNYVLIGPMLHNGNSHEFVSVNDGIYGTIAEVLHTAGINAKVGYWDVAEQPIVILVDFVNRHNLDILLYNLWNDFKVDSLYGGYDYQEPILFATTAGEVIEILVKNGVFGKNKAVLAHFHEWMCGAGLLYLKKHCREISTIFTTHATVLGRSLAGNGISIYNLPHGFDPSVEAKRYGVPAKHSLEKITAHEAHCFTTVSSLTADEACIILDKYPDKVVYNGLNITKQRYPITDDNITQVRNKLREIASKVTGKLLPENSLLFVSSGRYEFHNKGFDVLLHSLAKLEASLTENSAPIVLFLLVAVNWRTEEDNLLYSNWIYDEEQKNAIGIATHRLNNPKYDSVIQTCHELNLQNSERKIHVVYSDAYLNGSDGVFNIAYDKILEACDFSFFPSFYEPWGYTPQESIAQGTPTVTTNLAGFGNWVGALDVDHADAVYVLERKNKNDCDFIIDLTECLKKVVKNCSEHDNLARLRNKAFSVAKLTDWNIFFNEYRNTYYQAIKFNEIYQSKFALMMLDNNNITTIHDSETHNPRFRTVQYDSPLPEELSGLRDLAFNFWWAWHEKAKKLFRDIDPILWEQVHHNPVYFLNQVSRSAINKVVKNKAYMHLYEKTLRRFNGYINQNSKKDDREASKLYDVHLLNAKNPVAYFCMEYGIDECLPIYSGGLGILAGDYLKAMSDLKMPFIAIGLLYKQGYFLQNINSRGEQVAMYETWNKNQLPLRQLSDEHGNVLLINVEILDHAVYAKVWEANVGCVKLYLLDTDVPENNAEDREITNSLYGGTTENRLKQEILLGIGGTRFILEKLQVNPAVYHLNEGHSAFLLLERIRQYQHSGFSLDESMYLVKSTSIFTTHTPVPAGNEEFSEELIRKYFSSYAPILGLSMDKLFDLASSGVENNPQQEDLTCLYRPSARTFSMTALALRLCVYSNAVSTLHGVVARQMWQSIWSGLLENEIPITHVTNGVHLGTWLGRSMRGLLDEYIGVEWRDNQDDEDYWQRVVTQIPDKALWKARHNQKEVLLDLAKQLVLRQYSARNESKELINNTLKALNSNTLVLGLARRFTAYKRNSLFLRDRERLARLLTDDKRPVIMLVAGKAHPADGSGGSLIHEIIEASREPRFKGHIIFLEEYNIGLAKALVQGVDIWINTPILGREACGTSGMKVGINGGINFSTKDGWWEEACSPKVGWEIESAENISDMEKRNDMENMLLLNTLENEIIATYYAKSKAGLNAEWLKKVKESIALTSCVYGTARMAKNYIKQLYSPTVIQSDKLKANEYNELKDIVCWQNNIAERFNTVKIKGIIIDGIKEGKITSDGEINVKLLLFAGKLNVEELQVELILVKTDGNKFVSQPIAIPLELQLEDNSETGLLHYALNYRIEDTGFYSYGIRVFPYNNKLLRYQDVEVFYWG